MKRIVPLLLLTFSAAHCGDSSTGPQAIAPGVWNATTTGMSLAFTVNSAADGITQITYTFSGLQCGGTTLVSGSITSSQTPAWPITNRSFQITRSTQPTITVAGTFGSSGTTASGSWTWLGCSGTWTGSH